MPKKDVAAMKLLETVLLAASLIASPAQADDKPPEAPPASRASPAPDNDPCVWDWLCDGRGQCKQMPVCDSLHDKPGPKPQVDPPKPPPLQVPPMEAALPEGVARCEWVLRQNARTEAWRWVKACYCADNEKRIAGERPFSGIARCS
jgi:hypothetical protein